VTTTDRLFALLPALHRLRDADNGNALYELLSVIAREVDVLDEDLAQFYDDLFIETCARWAAPYIGELIGYRPLYSVAPAVASPRAEVANTIRYRRRKGTAAMLEQLALDVTGWPGARAVEFFERLVTTQYMNHVRPQARATPDMRDVEALGWITAQAGAFDDLAHTGDVRRIAAPLTATRGRYNIPNVGIFLWRTDAVGLVRSPLVPHGGDGQRFRFDAEGADAPIFGVSRTEGDIASLAEPADVPLPLGRRWLPAHLGDYYGLGRSLLLEEQADGGEPTPVPITDVRVCDLSDAGAGAWAHQPPAGAVAVDPVLGRVSFGTALPAGTRALATYQYGLAVPVGAGGYVRGPVTVPDPVVSVGGGGGLPSALNSVKTGGTVMITDSDRYVGTPTITTSVVGVPDIEVVVRADERQRPVLAVGAAVKLAMDPRTTVVLDGLHVTGGPIVLEESGDTDLRTIVLRNCTLTPGQSRTADGAPRNPDRASLIVLDPFAVVRLEKCVLGPIVAVDGAHVTAYDCGIDASAPGAVAFCGRLAADGLRTVSGVADHVVGDGMATGGDLDLHECTVHGGIHANQLDASNCLLVADLVAGDPRKAAVWARRRQVGCMRFSWLPRQSRVGKRYRCQPDPADPQDLQFATRPQFTSLRFGDPAYLQLRETTPDAIRRGADDENEMGVTHLLLTPQRETNLLLRLDEYLRFGLEAGFFYAT
jgi:hypothetical protein